MITESNVELLMRNKVDEHRAKRSAQIAKVYHSALSESLTFSTNTLYFRV